MKELAAVQQEIDRLLAWKAEAVALFREMKLARYHQQVVNGGIPSAQAEILAIRDAGNFAAEINRRLREKNA